MDINEILMPALSPTMEEGGIAKWLVKPGDNVKAGDVIAEIETDKAIMEFEATSDCTIKNLLVAEGTTEIKVNTPIATLGMEPPVTQEVITQQMNEGNTPPAEVKNGAEITTNNKKEKIDQTQDVVTVRESIRDAIAEEMRRDASVFLLGEEVGEYQGAYKVSQGLLDEFGASRIIDTPITEHAFTG